MEFHKVGNWVIYENDETELVRQGWIVRAATHSCEIWLAMMSNSNCQ